MPTMLDRWLDRGQPGWQWLRASVFALCRLVSQARRHMASRRSRRGFGKFSWLVLLIAVMWWLRQLPENSQANAEHRSPNPPDIGTPAPDVAPPSPDAPIASERPQKKKRPPTVPVDAASLWASRQACEAGIAALLATPRPSALRVASWNLHWFPFGRGGSKPRADGGTDVAWMACAMASLRADVIAVQEVTTGPEGRSALLSLIEALDQHTGGRFTFYLDDCPDGRRQHLGFIYDQARVSFDNLRTLGALNAYGSACAKGLRPGVAGTLTFGNDSSTAIDLITLHLDSGEIERDYNNRLKSMRRMSETEITRGARVLAIGDFNTMGCSDCAPFVDVAAEVTAIERVVTPRGLHFVQSAPGVAACSEHFDGFAQWLDRALTNLPARQVSLSTAGLCAELTCQRPRTTSSALSALSDHCPIVVEIDATP